MFESNLTIYFCSAISLSSASCLLRSSETGSLPRWTCLNEIFHVQHASSHTHPQKHSIYPYHNKTARFIMMRLPTIWCGFPAPPSSFPESFLWAQPPSSTCPVDYCCHRKWLTEQQNIHRQIIEGITKWEHLLMRLYLPFLTPLMVGLLESFINNFATPAGVKATICGSSFASSADV